MTRMASFASGDVEKGSVDRAAAFTDAEREKEI